MPDGTKLSKRKISRILLSKFKAKPSRTNEKRGFQINKNDIEKISKQYEVIDEIKVLKDLETDDKDIEAEFTDKTVTQVTQVTHSKDAISSFNQKINTDDFNVDRCDDDNTVKYKPIDFQDKNNTNVDNQTNPSINNVSDKSNDQETDNILNNNNDSLDKQIKESNL